MRVKLGAILGLAVTAMVVASCQDPLPDSSKLGNIIMFVSTSGVIDSNGYKFTIQGRPVLTIQANDTGAFQNLKDSTYHITVSDIKAGCSLAGGPARDVVVPVGIVEEHWNFTCPAPP